MIPPRYPTDAAPMVYECIRRQMFSEILTAVNHNCGPRGEELGSTGLVLPVGDPGRYDVHELVDVA